MSEIKSESISSLVDNYSPSSDDNINAHLIDNMLKDEELSKTWQNYHLIGDVLRDEVPESLDLDLSNTIAAAIAQEATILSPNSSSQFIEETDAAPVNNVNDINDSKPVETTNNVVDATSRFKAKLSQLAKPFGQVAIAASAAALMIVGVQTNVAEQSITPNQVVQTIPLGGYANPVSFSVNSSQSEQSYQSKQQAQEAIAAERVAQQRRLHALLKDHNQQIKLSNPEK